RAPADPLAELTVREAQGAFDEELARLPERLRGPLVLCCLEGMARDEAARQLGCPLTTLKGRLEQAREVLRSRLLRRGLTLPAGLLAASLAEGVVAAAVPAPLLHATARAACLYATGPAAGGVGSTAAISLADAFGPAFAVTRRTVVAGLLLLTGL